MAEMKSAQLLLLVLPLSGVFGVALYTWLVALPEHSFFCCIFPHLGGEMAQEITMKIISGRLNMMKITMRYCKTVMNFLHQTPKPS